MEIGGASGRERGCKHVEKTVDEVRIIVLSSDVFSSDLGPVKYGMESRKQWNIGAVQYLQQHLARRTAENAIFVLQPKSLCAACFNSASGRDIAGRIML